MFYAARCDVLLEEVFVACHAYVSPSVYHQQCRFQACRCGRACLCTSLSHYAYICNKHHVTVNFRAHVSECGSLPIPTSLCLPIYLSIAWVCLGGHLWMRVCRYGVFRRDDVSPVHISMREDVSVNQQWWSVWWWLCWRMQLHRGNILRSRSPALCAAVRLNTPNANNPTLAL